MSDKNQKWNSNLNFILAMIGSAVGLGNIWRYPYVAYTNGGGAFFVPYIISIVCIGIPLLFFEYGSGYKFKAGISKIVRRINEKYEYIGWFILTSTFLMLTYYCTVISWSAIYVPLSFFKGWGANPGSFFNNVVLEASNPGGLFHIAIYVMIAMLVIWAVLWFISHKDLNDGVGRFSKVLIPLLFVMMAIIVLYAVTLPGASLGIMTLLKPDLSSITNLNIWLAAFGQILFSLSIGVSVSIAYASYLPEETNITRNALIVAFSNCSFEVFTAIGVFSILGFMSTTSHVPISSLVTEGTGLAFVVFPQIFNMMGFAGYILGPLFFICLLFAGITSDISAIEPIALAISEKFNKSRSRSVTITCIAGLVISLMFGTSLGSTLLGIFDTFVNNFCILLNIIIEIILIAWIYGIDDIVEAINSHAKFIKVTSFWVTLIKYVLPVIIFIVWISGVATNLMSGDLLTVTVELLLFALLLILPLILTKLPAKSENY